MNDHGQRTPCAPDGRLKRTVRAVWNLVRAGRNQQPAGLSRFAGGSGGEDRPFTPTSPLAPARVGWLRGRKRRLAKPLGVTPLAGSNPAPTVPISTIHGFDHPSGWGGDGNVLADVVLFQGGPPWWNKRDWQEAAERLAQYIQDRDSAKGPRRAGRPFPTNSTAPVSWKR